MVFTLLSAAASAMLLAPSLADPTFYIYPDNSCSRAGYFSSMQPSAAGKCSETTFADNTFNKSADNADEYLVWVQFENLDAGCAGLIYEQNGIDPSSDNCGTIKAQSTKGDCVSYSLPSPVGLSFCCGDDCTAVGASPAKNKRNEAKKHARAFTFNRPSRRDDCTWGQSDYVVRQGVQTNVATSVDCEGSNDCPQQFTYTTSVSETDTFEVGASISSGFLGIVEATASFSYSYSMEQGTSVSRTTTVNVPAGKNGRIDFVPKIECSTGSLAGTCPDGYPAPGQSGDVCIPAITNGVPQGDFVFVEEF